MPILKYIFFIFLLILISLFAAKNMHTVEVHFFDGYFADNIKIPVVVLVSGSFGLGFFVVWFFDLFIRMKLKSQLHLKDRKIKSLEDQLLRKRDLNDLTPQENSMPATET